MKLLLDTHAVLWLLDGDERVPDWLRESRNGSDELLVSDVSIWEVAIKRSHGRIEVPGDFPEHLDQLGFGRLEISSSHVWAVGDLEFHHRDPFDRLLVAQAMLEGVTLVSSDREFARYGISLRW